MTVSFQAELAPVEQGSTAALPLLTQLLLEQRQTAVEQFSAWHAETAPRLERYYRDLLPLRRPEHGEQYAFEVDLDACSGCKACVVACHNLNGLEPEETWRSVGLLHGGGTQSPVLQHVTTACHHCLQPACLDGCPVEAYEKDPVTGIVRHLDDQCIGCQYCILKCPYDAPQYVASKGIVRKCDMCSSRLAVGEAPACVQACPNQAIRITLVGQAETAENAEANQFLPGAPEPCHTLPTTIYKTRKPLPSNLLPADYYSASPQHAHWSLVLMLVFTQLSVGAFVADRVAAEAGIASSTATRGTELLAAFGLGVFGLAASLFHLGRPHLAYRAVIGWRKSWLSREVIAFGAFALCASLYSLGSWSTAGAVLGGETAQRLCGAAVVGVGITAVLCSAMIYASTHRPFWNPVYTGLKFLLTTLVLGLPLALLIRLLGAIVGGVATAEIWKVSGPPALTGLMLACGCKLIAESAIFGWLKTRQFTPLRRTALLLLGDLGRVTSWRYATGILGGIVVPGLALMLDRDFLSDAASTGTVSDLYWPAALTFVAFAASLVGELLERRLFFAAVVAPKMPGAPAP